MFGWDFLSACTVCGMSHRYDTILARHFRKRKGFDEKSVILMLVQLAKPAYLMGSCVFKKLFYNRRDIRNMTAKGENNTFIDKSIEIMNITFYYDSTCRRNWLNY